MRKSTSVRSGIILGITLISVLTFAQPVSQTFNASGTYTIPTNYTAIIKVEAWGGGGGGGGNGLVPGSGGGGGAYAAKTITLSQGSYAVVVGGGGSAGNNGANSTFNGTALVANGGQGGNTGYGQSGGAGGAASAGADVSYKGGNGGGSIWGIFNGAGGGGSAKTTEAGSNGSSPSAFDGGPGGEGQGNGGEGGSLGDPAGDGYAPGGGGGGQHVAVSAPGSGANGRVIVTVISFTLPVTFGSPTAKIVNGQLLVSWSTLTETNNNYFEVQASKDGENFTTIGKVDSKATDGNSSSAIQYDFATGASSAAGMLGLSIFAIAFAALAFNRKNKVLYTLAIVCGLSLFGASSCTKSDSVTTETGSSLFVRIKQVDTDGTIKYSKVVKAIVE